MMDLEYYNSRTQYLDIIEIDNNSIVVRKGSDFSMGWEDECSYFIEKFSPSGYGEYEIADDNQSAIITF